MMSKWYDFNKAKRLVEQHKPIEASLGMKEDWFWTAETVYENGQWRQEFYEGDIFARDKEYVTKLKQELEGVEGGSDRIAIRAKVGEEYKNILLGGISHSCWATPIILLKMPNGDEVRFDCYIDDGGEPDHSRRMSLSVLSGPADNYIDSVPKGVENA